MQKTVSFFPGYPVHPLPGSVFFLYVQDPDYRELTAQGKKALYNQAHRGASFSMTRSTWRTDVPI